MMKHHPCTSQLLVLVLVSCSMCAALPWLKGKPGKQGIMTSKMPHILACVGKLGNATCSFREKGRGEVTSTCLKGDTGLVCGSNPAQRSKGKGRRGSEGAAKGKDGGQASKGERGKKMQTLSPTALVFGVLLVLFLCCMAWCICRRSSGGAINVESDATWKAREWLKARLRWK